MSKEERFETQFDGNKWLVADKENDTLLGGFGSAKMLNEFVDKISDLEAKLAEKEKEIENIKIDLEAKDFNINTLMEQRKRKQKFYNQDKISFALEQLEKVKGYFGELSLYEMYDKIDNQIKQLKEMPNEK